MKISEENDKHVPISVIYDTPDEKIERVQRAIYGGKTRGEVMKALRVLGRVDWEVISQDKGMIEILSEIYINSDRKRLSAGDLESVMNFESQEERAEKITDLVKKVLLREGRLPLELYEAFDEQYKWDYTGNPNNIERI